jgi:hypothetical protein
LFPYILYPVIIAKNMIFVKPHSYKVMKKWAILLFAFLLCFYTFVECYDLYWSIRLQTTLYADEVNPLGRLLMDLDGGCVALFMSLKTAALAFVVSSLPLLYIYRPKTTLLLLTIAVLSRVALLLFLEFGHLLFSYNSF